MAHFLWGGCNHNTKFHLETWDLIAFSYGSGGWVLKRLNWLSTSLRAKNIWWDLFDRILWGLIIWAKYICTYGLDNLTSIVLMVLLFGESFLRLSHPLVHGYVSGLVTGLRIFSESVPLSVWWVITNYLRPWLKNYMGQIFLCWHRFSVCRVRSWLIHCDLGIRN